MIWPERFPFDTGPSLDYRRCMTCSCALDMGKPEPECLYIDCHCHAEWLADAEELGPEGLRALWGDK